jgi:hypothetical protein
LEVHNCVAPFTSRGKLHEFGAEKPISCAKPTHFDFFTINFTVWSHILSIGGDALTASGGAQYVTLQKYFLIAKCTQLQFFPTPPIKPKLGLQIGGRLLIANHLDQSLYC